MRMKTAIAGSALNDVRRSMQLEIDFRELDGIGTAIESINRVHTG
jgi:hypothetical protein